MIGINMVTDEAEADRILERLTHQINDTWERRTEINPSFRKKPNPRILDILRLLPRTNCRECGQPTCLVFATEVSEGRRVPDDCPALEEPDRRSLQEYLDRFHPGQ
jgi:ArsR family metal-binding transcriptional regulator